MIEQEDQEDNFAPIENYGQNDINMDMSELTLSTS